MSELVNATGETQEYSTSFADRWGTELEQLGEIDPPTDQWMDALAASVGRAALRRDFDELSQAATALRQAQVRLKRLRRTGSTWAMVLGRVLALHAAASAGAADGVAATARKQVEEGSVAHRFLSTLHLRGELRSSDLADAIGVIASQVSRTGSQLADHSLVARARIGRESHWSLSVRGRRLVEEIGVWEVPDSAPGQTGVQAAKGSEVLPAPAITATVVRPDLLERWARAHSPSSENTRRPLEPADLLERWLHERTAREELGRHLLTWKSVRDFVDTEAEFTEAALDIKPVPAGVESRQTRAWSLLREATGTAFTFGDFFPADSPEWQAQALVRGSGGRVGVVLLDAPSNPRALSEKSRVQVPYKRRQQVREVARQAVRYFELGENQFEVTDTYPDWLRRLILMYYLREECNIPTWTARVCFLDVNGETQVAVPGSIDDWDDSLERSVVRAGISSDELNRYSRNFPLPLAKESAVT